MYRKYKIEFFEGDAPVESRIIVGKIREKLAGVEHSLNIEYTEGKITIVTDRVEDYNRVMSILVETIGELPYYIQKGVDVKIDGIVFSPEENVTFIFYTLYKTVIAKIEIYTVKRVEK